MTADRAEIGLQVIANTLMGVDLDGAAQDARRRLLGRRRGHDDQCAGRSRVSSSPCASARATPAVQSLIVPAAEYQPAKRLKLVTSKSSMPVRFGRAARAAARLGVGHGRAARASNRARMPSGEYDPPPEDPPTVAFRVARPRDALELTRFVTPHRSLRANCTPRHRVGGSRRLQHRARPAAGAGPPDRARFALYWEDEAGSDARHHLLGPRSARPTACPTCCASLGVGRGDKVALDPAAAARNAWSRISPSTRWARSPCRCRSCSDPDALEYRLADSRGAGRVRRSAIAAATSCRSARELPRPRARDRRGGRRGDGRLDYDALLAARVAGASRRSPPRPSDPALHRLHERHHRSAQGRADAASLPARQPARLHRIRTTTFRSRATSSGRRPTGRGPAASWTRCCRRSSSASRSSAIAAASIRSAPSGSSRNTRSATRSCSRPRSS